MSDHKTLMLKFMKERHAVYLRRASGQPKPWTKDPILRQYRFTNVCRELDPVTQWIATNWRGPHKEDPHLWFAMCVARLLNLPASLEWLGYPVPWAPGQFKLAMHKRKLNGLNVFNAAYIVSTNGRAMDKINYIADHVLSPMWQARKAVGLSLSEHYPAPRKTTLRAAHTALMQFQGMGSFMAAQVVADLKYVKPLLDAPDWATWAASGPGSRRGLNRVLGRPVDAPWKEAAWLDEVRALQQWLLARWPYEALHAQDVQNCLCEFDKYMRVYHGEGRPKQLYAGV